MEEKENRSESENKDELSDADMKKVSGGTVLHPTPTDEPDGGGATGGW